MRSPVIVLKFGSSVLRSEADLPNAVHEIYRWVRKGHRVVAVISAIGNTTDDLLARANNFVTDPNEHALATLLATGEATSAALLVLALDRAGIPAAILDEVRLGLQTRGPLLNAEPCEIDISAIEQALDEASVAVVPGFVGRQDDGTLSLLGRGGTDLTAVFIAHALRADRCRLIKDVDGIFEYDPATTDTPPRCYERITWSQAREVSAGVVQAKAIDFAERHAFNFEVAALHSDLPSLIGYEAAAFYDQSGVSPPLRTGLLGAGTVGLGVYRLLAAQPERFEITGIAVRHLDRNDGIPYELLTTDTGKVVDSDCDLIIELIGGLEPARRLIETALHSRKHVITANKLVIARHGRELRALAERNDVRLLYSAAVGGVAPMLEELRRIAQTEDIHAVSGVVNGTTNFILDRLADGFSLNEATREAQRHGFAEADPATDLNGSDAAHKLSLLAHAAFDCELHPDEIEREGIQGIDAATVRAASDSGLAVRLVASLERTRHGLQARVQPQFIEQSHPFAQTHNERNCLEIRTANGGSIYVRGKGAGRWPTAEAVVAEVFDVLRVHRNLNESAENCLAAGRVL